MGQRKRGDVLRADHGAVERPLIRDRGKNAEEAFKVGVLNRTVEKGDARGQRRWRRVTEGAFACYLQIRFGVDGAARPRVTSLSKP